MISIRNRVILVATYPTPSRSAASGLLVQNALPSTTKLYLAVVRAKLTSYFCFYLRSYTLQKQILKGGEDASAPNVRVMGLKPVKHSLSAAGRISRNQ